MSEDSYNNGHVQCRDCKNLESYWKTGELAFFMCKVNPVATKKLESKWRKCKNFTHTNELALDRKKEIK